MLLEYGLKYLLAILCYYDISLHILIVLFHKEKNDNDWHQVYLTRAEKEQSEGSKNCLHRMSFADDAQRLKVENHG